MVKERTVSSNYLDENSCGTAKGAARKTRL